jgi:hypothetical protein
MKKIDEIEKKNPFRVPENYFEDINRKIMSDTGIPEENERRLTPYIRLRRTLLVAASIAGFMLIGYTAVKLLTRESRMQQVSEILTDINSDSLMNDIDLSSLEEDASEITISDEAPDVSKKDIIDYLIQDNIELNDIYEKL